MSTIQTEQLFGAFAGDPVVIDSVIHGVQTSLTMCSAEAICVGVSSLPIRDHGNITAIIGCHGDVSGFMTLNLSEDGARSLVSGFLGDEFHKISPEVVDGVGELANLVSGGIKKGLSGTSWAFSSVTVPSVIIGHNYQIAYTSGLNFISVAFELPNTVTLMVDQRLLQVSLSLLRL